MKILRRPLSSPRRPTCRDTDGDPPSLWSGRPPSLPEGRWAIERPAGLRPRDVARLLAALKEHASEPFPRELCTLTSGDDAAGPATLLERAPPVELSCALGAGQTGPARVVALESSPAAAQTLAALCRLPEQGAWPGADAVLRYRDLCLWDDPRDPTLRDRRVDPVARRLAGFLDEVPGSVLLLAPRCDRLAAVAGVVAAALRQAPSTAAIVVGAAATTLPEHCAALLPEACAVLRGGSPEALRSLLRLLVEPGRATLRRLARLSGTILRSKTWLCCLDVHGQLAPADELELLPPPGWGSPIVSLSLDAAFAELSPETLGRWLIARHAELGAGSSRVAREDRDATGQLVLGLTAPGLVGDEGGLRALARAAQEAVSDADGRFPWELHLVDARRPPAAAELLVAAGVASVEWGEGLSPAERARADRELQRVGLRGASGGGAPSVDEAGALSASSGAGREGERGVVRHARTARRLTELLTAAAERVWPQDAAVDELGRSALRVAGQLGSEASGRSGSTEPGAVTLGAPAALSLAWLREALGQEEAGLRAALEACLRSGCAGRAPFELARMLLEAGWSRQALGALGALPGLDVDPLWVAREIVRRRLAGGELEQAAEQGLALLDAFAPDVLCGVGPPLASALGLLRVTIASLRLAEHPGRALPLSERVLASPLGRGAGDLTVHGALHWVLQGPDQAEPWIERALRADPEHADARRHRRALDRLRAAPCASAASSEPLPASPPPARDPGQARGSRTLRRRPQRGAAPAMTLISLLRDEELGRRVVPLGPLALIAALREEGWDVELVDRQLVPRERFSDPLALVRDLGEPAPVIGLSAMADRLPLLVRCVATLREAFPDRVIVAGGPGPSCVTGPLMELARGLDVVVVGEGERTTAELLERLAGGGLEQASGCPGAVVRVDEGLRWGPPRPRIRTLDELPLPAYDLIEPRQYQQVTLVTSRGCPRRCAFCDAAALWGHRRAVRSVERVVEEVRLLAQRGATHLHIEDDTFATPRSRVLSFCDAMQEADLGLTWGCLARADGLDAALMDRMHATGCRSVFLGLESGSQQVLDRIGKGFRVGQGLGAARLAAERFGVRAYFIWGFPSEEWPDLLDTFVAIGLLRSFGVDACYSLLAPFPGTALYEAHGAGPTAFHPALPFPCLFRPSDGPEDLALIEAHPEVFPFFRTLPTPDWDRKRDLVTRYWARDLRDVLPR